MLMKKWISIALILIFSVIWTAPVTLSYAYHLYEKKHNAAVLSKQCNEYQDASSRMYNNGNQFLKSLLKRVCSQKNKEKNFPVSFHFSGFVQLNLSEKNQNPIETRFFKKNVFHYLHSYYFLLSHDIFHPPSVMS